MSVFPHCSAVSVTSFFALWTEVFSGLLGWLFAHLRCKQHQPQQSLAGGVSKQRTCIPFCRRKLNMKWIFVLLLFSTFFFFTFHYKKKGVALLSP